jgi:integrase
MGFRKRVDLELGQLYIYTRDDIKLETRWYCSFKVKGAKRVFKSLGIMSEAEASKEARKVFYDAEKRLKQYGSNIALSKNTVGDAYKFFKESGEHYVGVTDSAGRYKTIMSHWNNHLLKFFGSKTVIDERLQSRMGKYVEYRRRVINKKTGKRLHAKISTIKLEIVSAKQLLLLARQKGIGSDFGNLTLELSKSKLKNQRSKSTTFTAAEVEDIKGHFDREAIELETILSETHQIVDSASLIRSRSARTAARRLFLLERLRFFVAVALATGARVNEIRQIQHGDFRQDFKTVKIRRSKTAKGSNRTAWIDNEIWNIDAAYTRYMRHAKTRKSDSLVFADEEGNVTKQQSDLLKSVGGSFTKFLRRNKMLVDKKYGREKRNFYSTRHYFISKQANEGKAIAAVASSCGTSIAMIDATYYSNIGDELDETMSKKKSTVTKKSKLRSIKGGKK